VFTLLQFPLLPSPYPLHPTIPITNVANMEGKAGRINSYLPAAYNRIVDVS
jgi:hypothetical protein